MDNLMRIKSYTIAKQMVSTLVGKGMVSITEANRILCGVAQDLEIACPVLL